MDAKTHRAEKRYREIRAAKSVHAAAAIGHLQPGIELFILTFGQFSLIDALIHLLRETGPADVVLSLWTASAADLMTAARLLRSSKIRSVRLIIDGSYITRHPTYCEKARELFGDDSIRTIKSHAKFLVIKNARWNLAIRTSMNLNANPRMENIEISDDPALCGFLTAIADGLFAEQNPGVFAEDIPRLINIPEIRIPLSVKAGRASPSISRTG